MDKLRNDCGGKEVIHCSRICRGQIWFVRQDESITNAIMASNTAIMAKSRPYLIVSSNEDTANKKSIIYGFPCTTNLHGNWIADDENDIIVSYHNWKGELEVTRIMTGCLTPLDYSSIESYKCELNSHLMEKIDSIMMKHLFNSHICDIANQVVNEVAEDIGDVESAVDEKEDNIIKIPPKKRIRWSKGQCSEFISDLQKLKKGDVMKKYNITSDTALHQKRVYVQAKMKKNNW